MLLQFGYHVSKFIRQNIDENEVARKHSFKIVFSNRNAILLLCFLDQSGNLCHLNEKILRQQSCRNSQPNIRRR